MSEINSSTSKDVYFKIVQKLAPTAKLTHAWDLHGGVSAKTTVLELESQSGRTMVVVRQYGDANRKSNPRIASDEMKLLNLLQATGIPTPKPYFADESGTVLPTPYLVIEYIDGKPIYKDATFQQIWQMADVLADIHRVQDGTESWSYLPKQDQAVASHIANRPTQLDASLSEEQIRGVLEHVCPPVQKNELTLLHGDFWPGNLLWKHGQIAAIVDWEDAGVGDPLADLANTRLEVLMFFGIEAMQEFTERYRTNMKSLDYTNLPYWDLYAALRPAGRMSGFGLEPKTLETFRARHKQFVNLAIEQLGQ